jgi:2-polyprenyl-6-hydroxyphenyl methylase / 3-demethylubiquinone-9 3-methyltransferase
MPVDNQLYDRLADTWWDEDAWLNLLRTVMNPARFSYLRDAVAAHGLDPHGATALDVGCGGGLLAEEVARLGFRVTGVDPSGPSLAAAREHAKAGGLDIEYLEGVGEALPVADATFDLVYCCDVLEHVDDVPAVLREIRRALKPGGLFVYDTINRTPLSKLFVIKLFQDWEFTRVVEPGLHDHAMFIKPREMARHLQAAGLEPKRTEGLSGAANPLVFLRLMRARRRGDISMRQFAARTGMKRSRDRSISYVGHAVAG